MSRRGEERGRVGEADTELSIVRSGETDLRFFEGEERGEFSLSVSDETEAAGERRSSPFCVLC